MEPRTVCPLAQLVSGWQIELVIVAKYEVSIEAYKKKIDGPERGGSYEIEVIELRVRKWL